MSAQHKVKFKLSHTFRNEVWFSSKTNAHQNKEQNQWYKNFNQNSNLKKKSRQGL